MEDHSVAASGSYGGAGDHVPLDEGRLGGLFCQLERARFDGMLHVNSGERSAQVGFRAGVPVLLVDPTQGQTLATDLLEAGQVTHAQYSAVIASMTDGLFEDEAVAFCEHAVQLGYLTEQAADVELSQRIRTRLIQLLSWTDCETSLDAGSVFLDGRREFPQSVGQLVYMGVRTFYAEDYLERFFPQPWRTYLRLLAPAPSIARYFGLDEDEQRLIRRCSPEVPISKLLNDPGVERTHLLGLLLLLRLAELCELAHAPIGRELSGARAAPTRPITMPHAGERSDNDDMPTAPPPPMASPAQTQSGSVVQPRPVRPPSRPLMPSSSGSAYAAVTRTESRPLSSHSSSAAFAAVAKPESRPLVTSTPLVQPTIDATQDALREAAARTASSRKATTNVRRGPIEPEPRPAQPAPTRAVSVPLPAAERIAPQQRPEYAKAHLKELLSRRRPNTQSLDASDSTGKRDVARELRAARDLLRDQHYIRAEEVLRLLVQQEPDHEIVRIYHLWARMRAQQSDDKQLEELRELAKKLAADPEHGAFASYVLGHIYFSAKKDELAEKFFKRAHAADKNNKDAERHVLILERRKQLAAEAESAANRKLFGIQIPNKK